MTEATIASDFNEPFDIQLHLTSQITLHFIVLADIVTQKSHLCVRQVFHPRIRANTCTGEDFIRARTPETENIRQTDFDPLISR
jgi:hypothetical protein